MKPSISFEFFPPNTPVGQEKLVDTRRALNAVQPEFFSVTYGAGGTGQNKTLQTVMQMHQEGFIVAPHMSCIGSSKASVQELLGQYQQAGISRVVALRGDLPSGAGTGHDGDFRHASDLVQFIREISGDHFHIEVAAYPEKHPQAETISKDIDAFVTKVQAGADSAITQYFFNADAFFRFRDEVAKRQIDVPIVPGIMPITNFVQLARFSDGCGTEIPRWIGQRLAGFGDDSASIREFGHEVVLKLCQSLVDGGVSSVHFYTLNQAAPSLALCEGLGITRS